MRTRNLLNFKGCSTFAFQISKRNFARNIWPRNLKIESTDQNVGSYDRIQLASLSHRKDSIHKKRLVPTSIELPDYALSNSGLPLGDQVSYIPILEDEELLGRLRKAGQLAKMTLAYAKSLITIGMTTNDLDKLVHEYIIEHGGYPSPLGYRGFPKSICTSVNNVVCHGIPDSRSLRDGDIINVDITVYLNGFHGDTSDTVMIGSVDEQGQNLVLDTQKALQKAIEICKPGTKLSSIGETISNFVDPKGYCIFKDFCGHGIGEHFHQPPLIQHFRNNDEGVMLPGMVFTIEPLLGLGSEEYITASDGWTVLTKDGSRTAQSEHTILITETGHEILTL